MRTLLMVLAAAATSVPATSTVDDSARLEVIEDLSESLANDLLDLSVAVRDDERTRAAAFFAETLQASPFPCRAEPAEAAARWVLRHGWAGEPGAGPRELSRAAFLADWESFLDHFGEIEDVRFKVKEASFADTASTVPDAPEPTAVEGSEGQARIAFFVVGRDLEGRREWARGSARVGVRRGAERWQLTAYEPLDLSSLVATADLFSEVAAPAGVAVRRPAYGTPGNGGFVWSGAAAGDLDGDGWLDLFVTGPERNYIYLNTGDGRFRDASEETDASLLASGTAPLILDYDGDGDRDVFLSAVGTQVLLENRLVPDGKLRLWDVSAEAGVSVHGVGFSAAAADINGDARPDIYVAAYNHYGQVVPDSWSRATNGRPNLLFVSQPGGGYHQEAAAWGIDDRRWSYAAGFADVDGDGDLDLYVANDFGENALYIRSADRFSDEAAARGVLDPGNGMGVAFGDYDNDGHLDLHVTNMSSTAGNRILSRLFPASTPGDNVLVKLAAGNNLYRNAGDGHFRDVTPEVGPFSAGWAWGGGFVDFDNDGWEDLYTPNGFISGRSMKDT